MKKEIEKEKRKRNRTNTEKKDNRTKQRGHTKISPGVRKTKNSENSKQGNEKRKESWEGEVKVISLETQGCMSLKTEGMDYSQYRLTSRSLS